MSSPFLYNILPDYYKESAGYPYEVYYSTIAKQAYTHRQDSFTTSAYFMHYIFSTYSDILNSPRC